MRSAELAADMAWRLFAWKQPSG